MSSLVCSVDLFRGPARSMTAHPRPMHRCSHNLDSFVFLTFSNSMISFFTSSSALSFPAVDFAAFSSMSVMSQYSSQTQNYSEINEEKCLWAFSHSRSTDQHVSVITSIPWKHQGSSAQMWVLTDGLSLLKLCYKKLKKNFNSRPTCSLFLALVFTAFLSSCLCNSHSFHHLHPL